MNKIQMQLVGFRMHPKLIIFFIACRRLEHLSLCIFQVLMKQNVLL